MRIAAAIAATLLALRAVAACTPADAKAIAEAEKNAADADRKARQAESIAVRSGNPGAQARAERARAEADAAQDDLARLQCKATSRPDAQKRNAPALRY